MECVWSRNLEEIEEKNEMLRGFKQLGKMIGVKVKRRVSKKRRLRISRFQHLKRGIDEIEQKYELVGKLDQTQVLQNEDIDIKLRLREKMLRSGLECEYKIRQLMQRRLKIRLMNTEEKFDSSDVITLYLMKDNCLNLDMITDVLFYYLMRGSEPQQNAEYILSKLSLWSPPNGDFNGWYELCCVMLENQKIFTQYYNRLGNKPDDLSNLLYKRPRLLLSKKSNCLMVSLLKHLSFENIHQILMSTRDDNSRTHMFIVKSFLSYKTLYAGHIDELFKLLSIQDINGQTALHQNTYIIAGLLSEVYKSLYRQQYKTFLCIRDKNGNTALDVTKPEQNLVWLNEQVSNNQYVQFNNPSRLIVYNTLKRPGAAAEALSIFDALHSLYRKQYHELKNIQLSEMMKEQELLELIEKTAYQADERGDSGLIVIVTSHGSVGVLDDSEGNLITLKSIESAMCRENILKGQPKILITQCCQKLQNQVDDKKAYSPTHDHFCAVMSSVAGQPSTRGVFLTRLASELKKGRKEDIFKIVGRVCKEMELEKHPQTPIILGTLKSLFKPADQWTKY